MDRTHKEQSAESSPEVVGQLRADVSSPQQCAVIQEVIVCPLPETAGFLPGMPGIEGSHHIPLPHCKPVRKYTSGI